MLEELNKKQLISFICIIVIVSGFIGWAHEVFFYYMNSGFKTLYWRGGNFLPWINIYAWGALLMLSLTYKNKNHPLQVCIISMAGAGLLEFLSGYILYGKLGWTRSWDYSQEIFSIINIGGYVSLRSVLEFGLAGLFLIYFLVPIVIKIVTSKYQNIVFVVSIILCSIVMIDEIYNLIIARLLHLPRARDIYRPLGLKYLYFK